MGLFLDRQKIWSPDERSDMQEPSDFDHATSAAPGCHFPHPGFDCRDEEPASRRELR
jgi:hypothetical protein